MTIKSDATVIRLRSHRRRSAARRRERLRREAMLRHPSYQSRQGGDADAGDGADAVVCEFRTRNRTG